MKKLLVFLTFVFLLQGAAMAQFSNHPRFAVIDTLVKSLITKVGIAEATYFAANQVYFQGIITPSAIQDGTVDAVPNWSVSPSDQPTSWKEFDPTTFKTNFRIPFQIRIDVYQSPRGWGWILTIDIWKSGLGPDQFGNNGDHWRYIHHEGPDPGFPSQFYDVWLIRPVSN